MCETELGEEGPKEMDEKVVNILTEGISVNSTAYITQKSDKPVRFYWYAK